MIGLGNVMRVVSAFALLGLMSAHTNHASAAKPIAIKVYKTPQCGCCKGWVKHLQANGFQVETFDMPDLSSVTELAIDTVGDESFEVVLEPDDYDLLPLNLVPGQGGYTEIRLKATAPAWFIVGYQARVTAIWGFGTVPAAVQQACILIANRYFHRLSVPFSMWESPQTGELATLIDRDWDVMNLLSPYMTSGGAGRGAGAAWVLV